MKITMNWMRLGLLMVTLAGTSAWAVDPDQVTQSIHCQVAGPWALFFDGSNDFVGLGNTSSLQQMTGDISVLAWVQMQAGNTGRYMGIAGKLSTAGRGFALVRHDSNVFRFWTGNGSILTGVSSTSSYTDTEWHHVTGVMGAGVMKLYIDGLLQAQGGSGQTILDSGEYAFAGRQYSNFADRFWGGLLDDVRFYKRALSAPEVVTGMSTPPTIGDTGLVGYWRFDDGSGQAVADQSGLNNNGTLGSSVAVEASDPTWFQITGCQPSTFYVDGLSGNDASSGYTPDTAFKTIQRGINAASNGAIVQVADGTYRGTGNKELDFLGKAITVKSANGPAAAIIDCQNSGRAFYFHTAEGADSIVDGFTLKSGNSTKGGAVYCVTSSPLIKNCIMANNTSPLGGAVYGYSGGQPVISNCVLLGNTDPSGKAVKFNNCAGQLINCLLYGNTCTGGGGAIRVENGSQTTTIRNCTVANNSAGSVGGGLYFRSANAVISNSIFWDNTAGSGGSQISSTSPANLTVRYSDVAGGQAGMTGGATVDWGSGNLNDDPLFADVPDGDYHLKSERGRYWPQFDLWVLDSVTSPCIDAGDPADMVADEPDPNGGRINMGAEGGTTRASLSMTPCTGLEGDVNHDGVITFDDLFQLVDQWLLLYGDQITPI